MLACHSLRQTKRSVIAHTTAVDISMPSMQVLGLSRVSDKNIVHSNNSMNNSAIACDAIRRVALTGCPLCPLL